MCNNDDDNNMSEILDSIIIDLKVIQKVPPKGRLCTTSHGQLKLEIEGNYATLKRTINGDSRKKLVDRLKTLTSGITEISDNIISSLYLSRHYERDRLNMWQINENSKKCHQLRKLSRELGECGPGLVNLKNTYEDDVRRIAELDQIQDKFSEQIKKIDNALKWIAEEEKKLLGGLSTSPQPSPSALPSQPQSQSQSINRLIDDSEDSSEAQYNNSSSQISIDPFE